MSRIRACFSRSRSSGRAALIGYLTAYDPDRNRSKENLFTACESGLDLLELGVPFSDPAADGPEVAAAMVRAQAAGATVANVLELAREIRHRFDLPIVLFSYANPLLRYGAKTLCTDAADAGVDGLLAVDLPHEHDQDLRGPAIRAGLDWIGLCAPTSPPDRRASIAKHASGFIYAVTLMGVTGTRLRLDQGPQLATMLGALRTESGLPVAAGFGIRTPDVAATVATMAEGVVVGSAFVAAAKRGRAALAEEIRAFSAAMAIDRAP